MVTWPNDNTVSWQEPSPGQSWEYAESSSERQYDLTEDEYEGDIETIINVRHEDCEIEIPIVWQTVNGVVAFHDDEHNGNVGELCEYEPYADHNYILSNGNTVCDYYWGNYFCGSDEGCTPLGIYYTEDPVHDCDNNGQDVITPFIYIPNDESNPCGGGGYMEGWVIDNGIAVEETNIFIPAGIPYSEVTDDWVGAIKPAPVCSDGGGCIFSAIDIPAFNIILGKPILAQYCHSGIGYTGSDCDDDGVYDEDDPCPCEPNNNCANPDNDGGDWGPIFDPVTECSEAFEANLCYWIRECPDEDPIEITGTIQTEFYSGYYPPTASAPSCNAPEGECWYCFSAEVCRVETPDETIIHVYEYTNRLSVFVESQNCDPSEPNSCYGYIQCSPPDASPFNLVEPCCDLDCEFNRCITSTDWVEDLIDFASDSTKNRTKLSDSIDRNFVLNILALDYDADKVEFIEDGFIVKKPKSSIAEYDVFPNPSNGTIVFRSKKTGFSTCHIQIFDMLGRLVVSKKDVNISDTGFICNLDQVTTGVYTVLINEKGKVVHRVKIVISQ